MLRDSFFIFFFHAHMLLERFSQFLYNAVREPPTNVRRNTAYGAHEKPQNEPRNIAYEPVLERGEPHLDSHQFIMFM